MMFQSYKKKYSFYGFTFGFIFSIVFLVATTIPRYMSSVSGGQKENIINFFLKPSIGILISYPPRILIPTILIMIIAYYFGKYKDAKVLLLEHNKRLLDTENKLVLIDKEKNTFINRVSNKLRDPIFSIKEDIMVILNDAHKNISHDQETILNSVLRGMNKLELLMDNIMALSKLKSDLVEVQVEKFSLNDLINGAIDDLHLIAEMKKISLKSKLKESIVIQADKEKLMHVVMNLIDNAIKYSKEGGSVILDAEEKSKETIISIKDNGIGISKEHCDKIFQEGYTVDNKGPEYVNKSFGIGLRLCTEYVEAHKGKIWVESELGKGSTFFISIPK